MEKIILYECDPEKNANCAKRSCWLTAKNANRTNACKLTKDAKYARITDGKPAVSRVVYRSADLYTEGDQVGNSGENSVPLPGEA